MNNHKASHEDSHLTEQEQAVLESLFEHAQKVDRQESIEISAYETQKAYQKIQAKRGLPSSSKKSLLNHTYFKIAVAALLVIGLMGVGYMFTSHHINVPNGSTRVVNLPDGTTITLNSGSTLSYPRWFNLLSRTVSLDGEAFFEVTHTGRPFKVETENALVKVMGTTFNIRSWSTDAQQKTSVFLQKGKISFSSKNSDQQAVLLKPGEFSSLSKNQPVPDLPKHIKQSKVMAWFQHGLAFENQPLSVIFSELNRRFDVHIQSESDRLLNEKLTIYISKVKSAEQTLGDICRAKNLIYTKNDDTYNVSKSPQ